MAGRPRTRAKKLAQENAARIAAGLEPLSAPSLPTPAPAPRPHTIPPAPKVEPVWEEPPVPRARPQRPEEEDPLVTLLTPQDGPEVPAGGLLDQKDKLYTELLGLALDRALDIMRIKPGDENFDKQVLTRQASIIASVLSTTARIDEARLKGRGRDRVSELLDEIRRSKSGMN